MSPLAIVAIAAAIYVLPSLIAVLRGRKNQWVIVALDLLLGWTILGWMVAAVWACGKVRPPRAKVVAAGSTSGFADDDFANDNVTERAGVAEPDEIPEVDHYADWLALGGALAEPERGDRADHPPARAGSAAA